MIHSIKVGKLVLARLTGDAALEAMVGESKVFPIVAENGTEFPFIVYTRTGITPATMTKDGCFEDTVTFQVTVCSDSYFQSLDVADKVRELLEIRLIADNDLAMSSTYMTSMVESYIENTYIQQMTFTTKVQNVK